MKFLVALALLLLNIASQAQNYNVEITSHSTSGGTNLLTGQPFPAVKYDVETHHIVDYRVDYNNDVIYLHLKKPGNKKYHVGDYYAYIDIKTGKVISQCKVNGPGFGSGMYDDYIYRDNGQITEVFDPATGDRLWKTQGIMAYVLPSRRIGITADGMCFDMLTGEKKWYNKIEMDMGWGDMYFPDSNTLIIAPNGLQCIDINTGKGWYKRLKTGKSDYTAQAVGTTLGMIGLAVFGVGMIPTGGPVITNGMNSNITAWHSNYCLAGASSIMSVDKNGTLLWSTDLPYKAGHSKMWTKGDTLIMVNMGYAYVGGGVKSIDDPFIASFNAATGELLYSCLLQNLKYITDYCRYGDRLLIRTDESIMLYDIINGKSIDGGKITESNNAIAGAYYRTPAVDSFFVENESGVRTRFDKAYPKEFFLMNDKGRILRLDNHLQAIDTIGSAQYGYYSGYKSGLAYSMQVTPDNKILIGSGEKMYAQLPFVPPSIKNKKVVEVKQGSFTVIDISSIPSP